MTATNTFESFLFALESQHGAFMQFLFLILFILLDYGFGVASLDAIAMKPLHYFLLKIRILPVVGLEGDGVTIGDLFARNRCACETVGFGALNVGRG